MPGKPGHNDAIDRILAVHKGDIEKFKAQQAARKGGRKADKGRAQAAIDGVADDISRDMRAVQQMNPSAMLGSSSAPMAPPSVARDPIMTPLSGGGIFQGAVAQINQFKSIESQSKSWASERRDTAWMQKEPSVKIQHGFPVKGGPSAPMSHKEELAWGSLSGKQGATVDAARDEIISRNLANQKSMSSQWFAREDARRVMESAFHDKQSGSRFSKFEVNRVFHLISKGASIAGNINADNSPGGLLKPAEEAMQSLAPLLPFGLGLVAYSAAAALRIKRVGMEGAKVAADSEISRNMMRSPFGDDKTFDRLRKEVEASRDATMTPWEKLKAPFKYRDEFNLNGDVEADKLRMLQARAGAYEKMAQQSFLYGNDYSQAVNQWSAKNKMPINEEAKRQAFADVTKKKRDQIENEPAFQRELKQNRIPYAYIAFMKMLETNGGKFDEKKLIEQKKKELLDDIINGKIDTYGGTKVTKAYGREEIDRRIEHWEDVHSVEIHKQDELSRNIELKMKAERHRHLAEW